MAEMKNDDSTFFYLNLLIRSHIITIATGEGVLVHSIIFLFYIPHINFASFWSSVNVNFNVKLKIYLQTHGSNNNILVL